MALFEGLGRNELSQYTYHWFWGLRHHQEALPHNLLFHINQLVINGALNRLIAEQEQCNKRNFFLRFFYYVFNINDAALNGYLIAAVVALIQAKDPLILESESMFERVKQLRMDTFPTLGEAFYSVRSFIFWPFKKAWGASGIPDSGERAANKEKPYAEPNNNPQQSKDDEGLHQFTITNELKPFLEQLGIETPLGERLTWAEVRTAFRKKALQVHPDKAGGSKETFQELLSSFDGFKNSIFRKITPTAFTPQWVFEFNEQFSNICHRIDETDRIKKEIQRLKEEKRRQKEEILRMREEQLRMREERLRYEEESRSNLNYIQHIISSGKKIPPDILIEAQDLLGRYSVSVVVLANTEDQKESVQKAGQGFDEVTEPCVDFESEQVEKNQSHTPAPEGLFFIEDPSPCIENPYQEFSSNSFKG